MYNLFYTFPLPVPCSQTIYSFHSELYDTGNAPAGFNRSVYLYYGSDAVAVRTTRLVMGFNDLVSAVGGGIGLFLGLSVYAVAEFGIGWLAREG